MTTVVLANDVVQDIEYAQATADGKNTIYYSATEPSGGTYTEGDLWFETDNDNALSRWDGAAWQSFGLGNAAFSNIDAGKITSGTISTAILFAGELTAARGTFGGFISAGNVQIGDGIYSNANYRGLTLNSSDTNNAWYVDTSTGNVYFKVGSATQYMEWTGSVLNVVGNISGSTVTGSTISTSTFSAGNPTGDGVSITGTQVTINTTGGTSSARLKFNTNAGSGDNFVDSDKRLVLRAGGGSANADKTIINIGRADGSNRDIVNVEATDLQLNGTSVLTSGSLPSGTIWTSDNDGAGSGLNADLLDGSHASAFADSGHNHSGVYSPTTHNHSGTYLPISGGTLTGNLTTTNITVPAGYGLYSYGWIFAEGNRIVWPGSGYGRLAGSTEVDGNFRTVGGGFIRSDSYVFADNYVSTTGYLNANGAIYGGSLSISGTKNFAIHHPIYSEKILQHAAVETPSADVFYRGKIKLLNGSAVVQLPDYYEHLVKLTDRSVIVTSVIDSEGSFCSAASSEIVDGSFTIKSKDCTDCQHEFYWIAFGVRKDVDFNAEPLKEDLPELGVMLGY